MGAAGAGHKFARHNVDQPRGCGTLGLGAWRLPAVYREVVLLRFQEDLSLEEIATVVKVPLSTVKSRLYRGLSAARELLEENRS